MIRWCVKSLQGEECVRVRTVCIDTAIIVQQLYTVYGLYCTLYAYIDNKSRKKKISIYFYK